MNSRLLNFVNDVLKLAKKSFQKHPKRLLKIVLLDVIGAAAKLLVVIIIALAIQLLRAESDLVIGAITIPITTSLGSITIFGVMIFVVSVLGALASYLSFRTSRELGRWSTETAISEISNNLASSPKQIINLDPNAIPKNPVTLLTQIPLHVGLSSQTIARMLNPIIMILFCIVILVYQNPFFSLLIVSISLCFLPLIFKTSLSVQSNSRDLYNQHAAKMGAMMNQRLGKLSNQHGVMDKQILHSNQDTDALEVFFGALDTNLLANQKMGFLVTLADSVMRPVLFVILCSMVFLNQFTIEETIIFLGSLAFLFASAKTAISLFTNLLRFYPQLKRYLRFTELSSSGSDHKTKQTAAPDTISFDKKLTDNNSFVTTSLSKGEIALCLMDQPLSSLYLHTFLPALLGNNEQNTGLLKNTYFISSKYRFSPTTLIEQLCGGDISDERIKIAHSMCTYAGSEAEFKNLKNGFNTLLDEDVWSNLSPLARFCLRIIPLSMNDHPGLIIINESIIKPMGSKGLELIKEWFKNSFIFLISQAELEPTLIETDLYLTVNKCRISGIGDSSWFKNQLSIYAQNNKRSNNSSELDLALL